MRNNFKQIIISNYILNSKYFMYISSIYISFIIEDFELHSIYKK